MPLSSDFAGGIWGRAPGHAQTSPLVGGRHYGHDVTNSWGGTRRGRFRGSCLCGGGRQVAPRTSAIETTIFNVLDFMLGGGEQDVMAPHDRRVYLDMRFTSSQGYRLGVEYDGAYWHRGREESDNRKSERLIDHHVVHDVMRIREAPLHRLGRLDLRVPRGVTGKEAAPLVLLHLVHSVAPHFGWEAQERIEGVLRMPARPINDDRVHCRECARSKYVSQAGRDVALRRGALGPPHTR